AETDADLRRSQSEWSRVTSYRWYCDLGRKRGAKMIKEGQTRAAFEPVYATQRQAVVGAEQEARPVVYYMGERIYFRPLELSDEPTLRRWINDPRNWRTLCHRGPVNGFRESEW